MGYRLDAIGIDDIKVVQVATAIDFHVGGSDQTSESQDRTDWIRVFRIAGQLTSADDDLIAAGIARQNRRACYQVDVVTCRQSHISKQCDHTAGRDVRTEEGCPTSSKPVQIFDSEYRIVHGQFDVSSRRIDIENVERAAYLGQIDSRIGLCHQSPCPRRERLNLETVVRSLSNPCTENLDGIARFADSTATGDRNQVDVSALNVGLCITAGLKDGSRGYRQYHVFDPGHDLIDIDRAGGFREINPIGGKSNHSAIDLIR